MASRNQWVALVVNALLVLLLVALLVLHQAAGVLVDDGSSFYRTLTNSAHVPWFAVVTLLLCGLVQRALPMARTQQYALVIGIGAVLAVSTELFQLLTGRNASATDVGRNIVGMFAGLSIHALAMGRTRAVTGSPAADSGRLRNGQARRFDSDLRQRRVVHVAILVAAAALFVIPVSEQLVLRAYLNHIFPDLVRIETALGRRPLEAGPNTQLVRLPFPGSGALEADSLRPEEDTGVVNGLRRIDGARPAATGRLMTVHNRVEPPGSAVSLAAVGPASGTNVDGQGDYVLLSLLAEVMWPGITIRDPVANWRGKDVLSVSLYVPGTDAMPLSVRLVLADGLGPLRRFTLTGGWTELNVPLGDLFPAGAVGSHPVREVLLYTTEEYAGRVLGLHAVRLQQATAPADGG